MEMDTNLLEQIQMYNFAAYDMLLYLDTHADDKTAFEMFRELVAKTRALKAQYEKSYGPLTAYSSADMNCFTWLESPWPWEKEANK